MSTLSSVGIGCGGDSGGNSGGNSRRMRFSLRTLLIVLTVVALCLGWSAYRSHVRRSAIDQLEKNFAVLKFGETFVATPWMRYLFGNDQFRAVNSVILMAARPDVMDKLVEVLGSVPEVAILRIHGNISDQGLLQVAELSNLQQLSVRGSRGLTNAGFARLRSLLELRTVAVENLAITDGVLQKLARIPGLNQLTIRQTLITPEAIENFVQRHPDIDTSYAQRVLSPGLWP